MQSRYMIDERVMNIETGPDDRFRAVCAALLLTPWVELNQQAPDGRRWKQHPIRHHLREHLCQYGADPFVQFMRHRYDAVGDFSAFFLLAPTLRHTDGQWWVDHAAREAVVALGGPAAAERAEAFELMLADGFMEQFSNFVKVSRLQDVWRSQHVQWAAIDSDCRALVEHRHIAESLEAVFGPTRFHLRLIPLPEAPMTMGFGPGDGQTAYCCLGPPAVAEAEAGDVRYSHFADRFGYVIFHEFAHTLWADAVQHVPAFATTLTPLKARTCLKGYLATNTPPWSALVDEIMVRAATVLHIEMVDGADAAQSQIRHEQDAYGLHWMEPAVEVWHTLLPTIRNGEEPLHRLLPEFANRLLASC